MSAKSKGSKTERELVHLFNDTGKWSAIRVAGSGLTADPNPDVLAGNGKRYLAIECKATKSNNKYVDQEQIDQITQFASKFGAECWLGIRFNNMEWRFLKPEDLEKTKSSNSIINKDIAQEKGLRFHELLNNEVKNGNNSNI
jgi:Holliday junction resolvase